MQKNSTEDKTYKRITWNKTMKRSLDDLIGKKKTIKIDGKPRDVMFPYARKNISIFGIKLPLYSPIPKFTRSNRGSIDSRIENYYGKVDIVKNKIYKRKDE